MHRLPLCLEALEMPRDAFGNVMPVCNAPDTRRGGIGSGHSKRIKDFTAVLVELCKYLLDLCYWRKPKEGSRSC